MDMASRFPRDLFAEFDRLQQQMDQMFQTNGGATGIRATARGAYPPVNVGDTRETVEVVAFAPGIDRNSLQVFIDRGLLTIAGERKDEIPEGDERISVYAQERFAGAFRRVINLPEDADPDRVEAKYQDGVLRVTVRKRESSIPRQIEVK